MKKTTIFLLSMFFAVNFFAAGAFASDVLGEVDIHGFISQGYLDSDDHKFYYADTDDGTFEFNEVGINFATELTDDLRLGIQLLSRDLGSLDNDEVKVDWAYADYRYRNWLGLRVGKVKKPNGMYNQFRDIDSARTCILLPTSIYNDAYRDAQLANKGVGIYGTLPGHVDYEITYGIFDLEKDSAVAQVVSTQLGGLEPSDTKVENKMVGQLFWNTPLDGLRIGGSVGEYEFSLDYAVPWSFTEPPSPVEMTIEGDFYLGSVEYTHEKLMISGEYRRQKSTFYITAPDNRLPNGTPFPLNDFKAQDPEAEDYYVMVTYRFTDLFELGAYYSVHYPDKDDKSGKDGVLSGQYKVKDEGHLKDYTLSLRFDINDYWIFKLEGHLMDGLADVEYDPADLDPDSDWMLFAAKVSFSF